MARLEFEALFGGAAGGGKSDALLAEALRQVSIPHYRGLIVRRTYPQLEALISRSMEIYRAVYPKARYNKTEGVWRFPSGAVIIFGSMQHENDKHKYQGRPFDFVGFDELTHFTYDQYMYLFSRCRPNGPGTRTYIRATANPGGVGHAWVKSRFIEAGPPLRTIWRKSEITMPGGKKQTVMRDSIFVPSRIFDNQALLDNDPDYLANLAMLPEAERNALLYGDWNSFTGQVFREWRDDPAHYRDMKWTHVIEPFMPPRHWRCWRGFDFGYAKPFSVGWYVADERGKIYRVRELYGCTDEPNHGVELHPAEIARQIREIETTDPLLMGRQITGVADPSIFDESRGQSIANMMASDPYFVTWSPGDNARLAGLAQYHYRLAFDGEGEPMFQVFNTNRGFLRTVPALVYDEKRVEDVDTSMEDHCVTGDTQVLTDKGWLTIKDMAGADWQVVSHDGKLHRCCDVRMTQKNVDVYTIETYDGRSVTATANHRFMLADGTWKQLDELTEGDELYEVHADEGCQNQRYDTGI